MSKLDSGVVGIQYEKLPGTLGNKSEKLEKPKAPQPQPLVRARNSSVQGSIYTQAGNDDFSYWLFENQTGLSFNLLALLILTHISMPKARPFTSKFFTLPNYNSNTGKYAAGFDDFYFMTFCIVLFTFLRAGFMEHIMSPLARKWGISKKKDATRFSEQAWLFVYCSFFWPLGMYIYCNSPYFLNMAELWTNWPDRELTGLMKGYMLAQWSFWIQQVLVINIEDRRKDHWQMLTHHFITIALVSASYAYHQTRVGNLILVIMDVIDVLFPLAKCLKYLGFTTICDVLFGIFMITWILARHVFYLMTCWSIYTDLPRIIQPGCYSGSMDDLQGPFPVPDNWSHVLEPLINPKGTVCWNDNVTYSFLLSLLFLQVITIMWFVLIVRVAVQVIKGGSADEIRSIDGGEEDEFSHENPQPLEEEVGVDDIDLKAWERRTGVGRTTRSSAVNLRGHSDHKEFLNRIGCEKQID